MAAEKKVLRERVEALCAEVPRDGYRRITRQLHAEGMIVNHKAVARLMRQHGLQVRPLRKFVRTTDSDHDGPIFPNLTRGFRPSGPNQVWVGDITYRCERRSKPDSHRTAASTTPIAACSTLQSSIVRNLPNTG